MIYSKKLLILAIVIFASVFNGFAQDNMLDSLNFEVSAVKEEKPPYFALGGGYTGTFLFADMTELNKIAKNYGLSDLKSNIYLSGVQGFTAIGIIPNLRLGFWGLGGSQKTELKIDTASLTRGLNYSLSFTGFSIDYGINLIKSLAVLPGISAGWVTATMEAYQSSNSFDFANFKPGNDLNNYRQRAEGSFYFIQPNLNLEYAVTPFLMARLNVGYSYSFSGDWKYNQDATLTNVPTGINANGMTVQFGVFVGLFNY